jgi:hypothetical protein
MVLERNVKGSIFRPHPSIELNRQLPRVVRQSALSEEEDITMPGTDDNHTRKAEEQEAERKRHPEQHSEDDKTAVKEPESVKPQLEGYKIIGNG